MFCYIRVVRNFNPQQAQEINLNNWEMERQSDSIEYILLNVSRRFSSLHNLRSIFCSKHSKWIDLFKAMREILLQWPLAKNLRGLPFCRT